MLSSKNISQNIKKYRKKSKLSQHKLAVKANVPYDTFVKIETGYTDNPSIKTLISIANALNTGIDDLIK